VPRGMFALGLDAMGLDIEEPDALELNPMEPDKDPNAMESDTGPEVLCRNLLV
jgi:hypothetical protein